MQMEGVRLVVNKGLSNHFQVISVTFYILPSQIKRLKADSISKAPVSFARFSAHASQHFHHGSNQGIKNTNVFEERCVCCLSGESQCTTEHIRRLYLQVWCNIRWFEADGSSGGMLQ